jgi:hypothetical protein
VGERRYDIDWLRMGAMLAVFLFHCARFFGGGGWHLQNAEESIAATLFIGLLDLWIMPLFFLLSGAGSWYALISRSPGKYLLDRVKRLLLPLYITGVLIFIPPQAYFEYVTHKGFTGTLWEFYPRYLINIFSGSDFGSPLFVRIFYGHLWFLQFLFFISLVLLPLLMYLKSERGLRLISRLAGFCTRRGGMFVFLIPLVLIRIGLTHLFEYEHTWEDFLYFSVFFLIGYIMVSDRRFTESFIKHQWLSLALGLVCFGGEVIFVFPLRFYIFHQTIILCVGWFVINWNVSIVLKYGIIVIVSFTLIIFLYEFLVRRFNIVRFLFGMRPKSLTN